MNHVTPTMPLGPAFVGTLPNAQLSASTYIAGQTFGPRVAGSIATEITSALIESLGYWSPLTNGDPVTPELIFDGNGDAIMVWTPT